MPLMDGIEASTRIRGFNKEVYIAGLTANIDENSRQSALTAGMNALYLKPLSVEDLRTNLKAAAVAKRSAKGYL